MARQASRAAFPIGEYEQRLERTRAWMVGEDLDLLFLTQPEHFQWLSGYDPTSIFYFQALVVPAAADRGPTLLYNRAEHNLYEETSWVDDVEMIWTYEDQIARAVAALEDRDLLPARRIGLNLGGFNMRPVTAFALKDAFAGSEIVDVTAGLDELRLVKSDREIEYLREAARVADVGLMAGIDTIGEGASDHEIMAAINHAVTVNGGEYPSYPFLCDMRGTLHGTPVGKRAQPGDVVCLEVSGVVRRYHCNIVRTTVVGAPTDLHKRLWDVTARTFSAAADCLRPGVAVAEVVEVINASLGDYREYTWGRFGFSMEVAYPPIWIGALSIMQGDQHVLEPGILLTLESGVIDYEGTSVLLGTNILVTEGAPEVLNDVPIELFSR